MKFTDITFDGFSEQPAREAVELLKAQGKTVSLAESCTGGLIAKLITDIAGSSRVFECGIVSYSNSVKQKLLGVSSQTLDSFTEISPQCAAEMAEGARRVSGADFALSVTGISGPGGLGEGKPAGLAYIGFARDGGTRVARLLTGEENDRDCNRRATAECALRILTDYLKGEDENG